MSSTNHTTNYGLSQFLGTDKPAWLVDYNGDMAAIDTQMKANADAASGAQTTANTADGKADTNATAISTLNTQINGDSGIASDVTTLQGSVNTINSLIGNGEPTTTDKTLIGAINEIYGDIQIRSKSMSYEAVAGDTTIADALNSAYDAFATALSGKNYVLHNIRVYGGIMAGIYVNEVQNVRTSVPSSMTAHRVDVSSAGSVTAEFVTLKTTASVARKSVISVTPDVTFTEAGTETNDVTKVEFIYSEMPA